MAFLAPWPTSTASLSTVPAAAAAAPARTPSAALLLAKRYEDDSACFRRCYRLTHSNACHVQSTSQWSQDCLPLHEDSAHVPSTAYRACACSVATTYVDCYSSLVVAHSCEECVYATDWRSYQSAYLVGYTCSVPDSLTSAPPVWTADDVLTLHPQAANIVNVTPTSANVSASTSTSTTSSTPSTTYGTHTATTANDLYSGHCQEARYTQVQDGSSVLWMAVSGCDNRRPECCPWNMNGYYGNPYTTRYDVAIETAAATATTTTAAAAAAHADEAASLSSSSTTPPLPALAFPTVPATVKKAVLDDCPTRYRRYKKSHCCPSHYRLFTRAIGGNTPCWSNGSVWHTAPALVITAGAAPEATLTAVIAAGGGTTGPLPAAGADGAVLPTSALGDGLIFTRSYQATHHLAAGAVAGIAVGCVVAALAVAVAGGCVWKRRRAARQARHEHAVDRHEEQAGGELDDWVRPPPAHDADTAPPVYKAHPDADERSSGSDTGRPSGPQEQQLLLLPLPRSRERSPSAPGSQDGQGHDDQGQGRDAAAALQPHPPAGPTTTH